MSYKYFLFILLLQIVIFRLGTVCTPVLVQKLQAIRTGIQENVSKSIKKTQKRYEEKYNKKHKLKADQITNIKVGDKVQVMKYKSKRAKGRKMELTRIPFKSWYIVRKIDKKKRQIFLKTRANKIIHKGYNFDYVRIYFEN